MRCGPMNKNYYLLTNLLTEEETKIITSIIRHIENDERRIGVQQIANENYVSPTYIIKMCKRLGFDGYSELYYHLQQTANANDRSSGAALQELIDNYDEVHFYDFMIFHEEHKGAATNIEPSLLIAISQSGEAVPILNDVRAAKDRGFKIICFTKREDSTLASLSDLVFIVEGSKQTLVGGMPNPFFGRVILAFEELVGYYFKSQKPLE